MSDDHPEVPIRTGGRMWINGTPVKFTSAKFIDESDPDVPVVDHVLLPDKETP